MIVDAVFKVTFEECDEMGYCPLTEFVVGVSTSDEAIHEVMDSRKGAGHFGLRNFSAQQITKEALGCNVHEEESEP